MQSKADDFYAFIQEIKDTLVVGEDGEKNKYLKTVTNKETGEEFEVTAYQEMDKS